MSQGCTVLYVSHCVLPSRSVCHQYAGGGGRIMGARKLLRSAQCSMSHCVLPPDLFVTNVLEEAVGSVLPLALDPSGSLLLQALLPEASSAQLAKLLRPLLPALCQAACHHCGAHVLEAALLRAPRLLGEEDAGTLEELVLQLGRAMREELRAFAWDPHASFVVRTLLQVLGGVRVGSDAAQGLSRTAKSEGPVEFEVPDSFLALLREFIAAFQENIAEFITHRVASLCLQVALEVLHRKLPEACAELCSSVIGYLSSRNPSFGCSPLLVFLKDPVCSRVLDKVLEVSEPRALRLLYRQHFRGQLRALAGHGVANFTLQRLLGAAPPKLVSGVLVELGPGLEEVLAQGHAGVATALLGACRRCGAGQKEALQLLMEAFHCWEPPARRAACAPLFASLLPYEVYYAPGKGQEAQPPLEEQVSMGKRRGHRWSWGRGRWSFPWGSDQVAGGQWRNCGGLGWEMEGLVRGLGESGSLNPYS
uniref:Uncharacterized protein n=1 Tax=Gopherus agassizii TaxID=38772 RepID=A0A452GQK8_9SAUR